MHPYLFELDLPFLAEPFRLRSFGLLVAIGFLTGAHLLKRLSMRFGDDPEGDPERYSRATMWILFGVFGGARLFYVAVEMLQGSAVGRTYIENPMRILAFWEGGLVMYGGLIGGVGAGLWCAKLVGIRLFHGLDLGLVAGFVGLAIGRVGCLMVGDDYGRVVPDSLENAPFPLVIRVPQTLPEGSLFGQYNAGKVLYATQVWMSMNALLLAGIGYAILRRRRYGGQVSLWLLFLYTLARFTIEAFRGDEVRGLWFGGAISTSQLVSLVAAPIFGALLFLNRRRTDAAPGRSRVAATRTRGARGPA
jgi:phosphatidylglycerol---prolipoprotein diacylglyceryl transferase